MTDDDTPRSSLGHAEPPGDTARARMEALIAAMHRSTVPRTRAREDDELAAIAWKAMNRPSRAELHDGQVAIETATRLGRYLPIEELGRGGMGRVLRAYDPKLQREVALKVLNADVIDTLGWARMVREARIMAKLNHPHVVAVYDVVDDPRHGIVLAMELVEGPTLRQWLRDRPRPWQEVLAAFVEAGRGLAAAHHEGLLHRDFKPANVLVALDDRAGSRGRVKVTDFGLAKRNCEQASGMRGSTPPLAVPSTDGAGETLTEHGVVLGTPFYMAPEQHRGDPLTPAADQYAFCVALWEALFDERPFDGSTPKEVSTNVLAGRLRSPPRARAVPGWLRRACVRGLAVEPTQRWPSMDALLGTLANGRTRARVRKGLAAVGVLAVLGTGGEGYRRYDIARRTAACEASGDQVETAWSPERRERLHDALVATGVSYAPTTAQRVMPWLERQAAAWREARVETCLDAELRGRWDAELLDRSLWCLDERRTELQSLVDELTHADAEVVQKAVPAVAGLASMAPCRDERVLKLLAPPPPQAREAIGAVRADVTRASNLQRAGRYAKGLALARKALEQAEALQWRPLSAKARFRLGSLLDKVGASAEAEAMLEEAYFEAAEGVAPGVVADAAIRLVYVVGISSARHAEGWRWGRLARVALAEIHDGEDLYRTHLLVGLAAIHQDAGAYAEAEALYEEALAVCEASLGPEHLSVALILHNLAGVHQITGAYDEAEVLCERALAIREQALGPDHPDVASSLTVLAAVRFATGEHHDAKASFERALATNERALGPQHPDVADSLANLAHLHRAVGAYDEAKVLYERALTIHEATLRPEHPSVAASLSDLASVHQAVGAYDEAKALYERALAIREQALGPAHPAVAESLHGLATVHQAVGAYDEARALYERALAIWEQALGPAHPHVAGSLVNLADVCLETGGYDEAEALYQRALAIREQGLGPHHPDVAYPLLGLAELALERHQPTDAMRLAQRAVSVRGQDGVAAQDLAEARFTLARALWDGSAGHDRARAVSLAEQVRDTLRDAGSSGSKDLAEVEQWLGDHGGDPDP